MRLLLPIAAAALALAGCADDDAAPGPSPGADGPPAVDLTPAERSAFLDRVGALGFTCRQAAPADPAFVACTRAGKGLEASRDTVRLTALPDGGVLRVSYCGPDAAVGAAFSETFLTEIGSPDLGADVPRTAGTPLVRCVAEGGVGFAAGGPVEGPLQGPSLRDLGARLVAAGWTCPDDGSSTLNCTSGRGDARSVAAGAGSMVTVATPDPAALAETAGALGLTQDAVDAAAACAPGAVCEHLVVDALDVTFDTDDGHARMMLRAAAWG